MLGNFDETVSVKDFLHHADTGIGTCAGLDGEAVFEDGVAYKATADGKVIVMKPEDGVAFGTVAKFDESVPAVELWGIADRTDYDLTQHQNTSGQKMVYREGEGKDMVEYIPYVIEPSLGVERSVLAVLCDAYDEEVVGQDKNGKDDVRVVMHFHPALAPFKAAILPLSKKEVLSGPAMELYNELSKEFMVDYDETGSIGKRYRRQDEIGTPFCITLDFETVGDENTPADHCVTIRERDTMNQVRIPIDQVKSYLEEKIKF